MAKKPIRPAGVNPAEAEAAQSVRLFGEAAAALRQCLPNFDQSFLFPPGPGPIEAHICARGFSSTMPLDTRLFRAQVQLYETLSLTEPPVSVLVTLGDLDPALASRVQPLAVEQHFLANPCVLHAAATYFDRSVRHPSLTSIHLRLGWLPDETEVADLRERFRILWPRFHAPRLVVFLWEIDRRLAPDSYFERLTEERWALGAPLSFSESQGVLDQVLVEPDLPRKFPAAASTSATPPVSPLSTELDQGALPPREPTLQDLSALVSGIKAAGPTSIGRLLEGVDRFLEAEIGPNPRDHERVIAAFKELRDLLPQSVLVSTRGALLERLSARLSRLEGTDLVATQANRALATSIEGLVQAFGGAVVCEKHSRPAHLRVKQRGPRAKEPRADFCLTHETPKDNSTTCLRTPGLPSFTLSATKPS